MTFAANTVIIGRQQRAAVVLLGLLGTDLPAATWELGSVLFADRDDVELDGHLGRHAHEGDSARLAALMAWAARLNAHPQWQQSKSGTGGKLSVTALITGVKVTVWTRLDASPADYAGSDQ